MWWHCRSLLKWCHSKCVLSKVSDVTSSDWYKPQQEGSLSAAQALATQLQCSVCHVDFRLDGVACFHWITFSCVGTVSSPPVVSAWYCSSWSISESVHFLPTVSEASSSLKNLLLSPHICCFSINSLRCRCCFEVLIREFVHTRIKAVHKIQELQLRHIQGFSSLCGATAATPSSPIWRHEDWSCVQKPSVVAPCVEKSNLTCADQQQTLTSHLQESVWVEFLQQPDHCNVKFKRKMNLFVCLLACCNVHWQNDIWKYFYRFNLFLLVG